MSTTTTTTRITESLIVESATGKLSQGCAWLELKGEPHFLTSANVAALIAALQAVQAAQ